MSVHFSSKSSEWATPDDFFEKVQKAYKLDIDVCASRENAKLARYWDKDEDGLSKEWEGIRAWMNPPYGREIGKWIEKAATGGASIVVALLPARTDTRWFHQFVQGKAQITFIKGRLKFGGQKNSAPFPSMLCVWIASHN